MAEEPITLARKEVRELWDFMAEVQSTLKTVTSELDAHHKRDDSLDTRITAVEHHQAEQRGGSSYSRWLLPWMISIGALVLSFVAFLRRNA